MSNEGTDATAIRRNLQTRQDRNRLARAALEEVAAATIRREPVHVHCAGKGCSTRLATVFEFNDGQLLFVSKIAERPVDGLQWPPWFRDQMLAQLADAPDASHDDEFLIRSYAQWKTGQPLRSDARQRWRVLESSFYSDLLTLPNDFGDGWKPALWVRCGEHPGSVQAIDRMMVMAAVASAQRSGKRAKLLARPKIPPDAPSLG